MSSSIHRVRVARADSPRSPSSRPSGRSSSLARPTPPNSASSGAPSVAFGKVTRLRSQRLDGPSRRLGLGHAPRVALTHADDASADGDLDSEHLVVVRSDGVEEAVLRPLAGEALGVLLQPALRALQSAREADRWSARARPGQSRIRWRPRTRGRGRGRRREPRRPRRAGPAGAGRRAGIRPRRAADTRRDSSRSARRARPAVLTIEARRAERTPSSSSGWRR